MPLNAPNVSPGWTRARLSVRIQSTSASGYVLEGKVAKGMKEAIMHASETPKLRFDKKLSYYVMSLQNSNNFFF